MKYCIVGLMLLVPAFSSETLMSEKVQTGFVKQVIDLDGEEYSYQVFVPATWTADKKWPVILFLHGAGERGSEGDDQAEVGIGPAIRRNEISFPAVVVMPQCRSGVWWNDPKMEHLVTATLEHSVEKFSGDRDRVYLTGLSMGGYGTLYFGAKHPEKFAALAPVCGGVIPPRQLRQSPTDSLAPYLEVAERIKQTPIWLFHGSADRRVPVSESRKMVEALKKVGGKVKYTEYEGVSHNSWDAAYAEPELFPWLLSKQLHPSE